MKKRVLSLLTVLCIASAASGCAKKEELKSKEMPFLLNEVGNEVDVIDDIPDWTGDKLDLIVWESHGTQAGEIGKKATNDKFLGELERVSGIKFDTENSFDNSGESGEAKIAKMAATKNWPDVGLDVNKSLLNKCIEQDKIYDLTEAIEKWAPNYMKMVNSDDIMKEAYENMKINGKMYQFLRTGTKALRHTEKDPEKYESIIWEMDTRSWLYVRDDILKKIYPEAKTQDEIEDIYMKNGKYTMEDITDVTIKSPEEFKDFLVKINNLGITENGRKVWPFYTHNGGDNWSLCTAFNSLWGAGSESVVDYFGYYDTEAGKIVPTVKQQWYKDTIKFYNELIREGLASKEALADNSSAFATKKLNGEYAVFYGNDVPPTDEQLKAAGKNYRYRKVLLDIPRNHNRFMYYNSDFSDVYQGETITVFKNNIKEDQLEQFIRFIDFFYSDAGQKYMEWGPKKSGLYETDENGNTRYTDKRFEKAMLLETSSDVLYEYGLESWPALRKFMPSASKYSAKVEYKKFEERQKAQYTDEWKYSKIAGKTEYPILAKSWAIWDYTADVKEMEDFWNTRQSCEDALKVVFTANSDEQFEEYYNKMVSVFEKNGLNDTMMEKWNEAFEKANEKYLSDFRNWKEK